MSGLFKHGIWSGNKGNEETDSSWFTLGTRAQKAMRAENHGLPFFRLGVIKSRAEKAQEQAKKR